MLRCSKDNCEIEKTNVCLEGHEQSCPHLVPEEGSTDLLPNEAAQAETDIERKLEPYHFHTGEKLTIHEASKLMNERPTRVVLCAGAQFSGKTTFLAKLGEMFRNGTFSGYRFAESLTLCAFERASWFATITSGVSRPDTRRTFHRENDTFYHLRVHPKDDVARQSDILLSDLAGETFPDTLASRNFCANLSALSRADHLVVFLNCEQLADPSSRHPEANNAREFLQQVCSVKHELKDLRVQVIFSRWDCIENNSEKDTHVKFCERLEADIRERFAKCFAALKFLRIAARPLNSIEPTNDRIQSLFEHWIDSPLYQSRVVASRNHQPMRDFCAFGVT